MAAERPDYIAVGLIRRPHGLHGEVQLDVLTDHPAVRFAPGASVWLGPPELAAGQRPTAARVASMRTHDQRLLVRFDGVDDRDAAAALSGQSVYVPTDHVLPLEADSYYPHELIGLAVVTTDGQPVGRVADLMNAGASDILVVQGERPILVPMIGDVIANVDIAAGQITIVPIPGLLAPP